jgi:outer membrane lipoprotein-sorting protein
MKRMLFLLLGLCVSLPAFADPSAAELMSHYDALMGPENFEATVLMAAHREDGSTRTYKMRVLKKGTDKFRAWFDEPGAVKGQEMLRQGDNLWVYMPQLKRAIRLANRDSFQGGDFNNADVLRVNYQTDYSGTVGTSDRADAYLLELKARTKDAAYDHVKLWLRKADLQPVKGEYYTGSGKLLRAADFSEYKDFGGLKRPGRIVMKNMLATQRFSTMSWESLNTKVNPGAGKFVLDDMGK